MTQAHERRDDDNPQVRDLAAVAADLLERAAAAPAGRAALTLVAGAGAPLKQTMLALRSGQQLAEHDAPGAATLQVVRAGCGCRPMPGAGSWARRPHPDPAHQAPAGEPGGRRRPADRGHHSIRLSVAVSDGVEVYEVGDRVAV